ncbi:4-hydroxy-tetrahydrodipicolinate reductase [Echinicola salinicaeni]|uniref:4-hydroxy-tetrahydrodipicolinate reductase n=1 Tax=Echinicola salinicaeni TaxID=2762757 RepID=UPI0016443EB2|nr:4-hydroxy-tetrahydrodipicolinate reductase [Echinicola salinicaeni]
MNILILGYGKMGKIISQIAEERGHTIAGKIDESNVHTLDQLDTKSIDVAIEFSQPDAAFKNLTWAIDHQIPVISGTTGWLDKKGEIEKLTLAKDGAFFYASNYSIGVNIFFKINSFLAKIMNDQSDYSVKMEEIHHTEKKDAPSGTAITLAEGIINNMDRVNSWNLDTELNGNEQSIPITAKRIDPAPGTHIINYSSEIDDIEIKHTAHSRKGFALGAVLVAEWIKDKKGVLSMDDFLTF